MMKEKLYVTQSIAAAKELLQVWDMKFLTSAHIGITLPEYVRVSLQELGDGWLPDGNSSSMDFKNQPGQPFFSNRMAYRYLNHCPSAPMYTTSVFLKLLTGGKKLGMYEPEFQCSIARERELCPWYLELWRQMPSSPFELDLYLKCHLEALLEGVEMPQDRDEIHIEQTEDERPRLLELYEGSSIVRTSKRMLEKPANTLYVNVQMHSFHPSPLLQRMTSKSYLHRLHINKYETKHVCPLSPMGSVSNVEIVIGDYFQLSNNNILRPDHISQVVDVASKVLRYEGIMLVILPRSLFWGGLLTTMAENDDSRLVEFASGCLLSNIPVETKGAGG
ncbi:hypothetical protein SELMODRAFT_424577 [Selaginella moellendorffii]|uniref:Uncharacterized protein n=1 Tax=Selaginella moellendorffii TaxID=88036 RepID=D8SQC8_SELML|nr:hypothetical protein SELMODRAFT_424577 [Selaginella moellendorffii]